MTVFTSIVVMGLIGLGFGVILAYASKKFHVPEDRRVSAIEDVLPGFNCASCGKTGCSVFAESVVDGTVPVTGCTPGGVDVSKKIADIMGVAFMEEESKIARILCNGGTNCKDRFQYNGLKTCAAAGIVSGGPKACTFGCIGFGDCVRACPFGAMMMNENGIPVVDPEKCTACGVCVAECPKNIIELVSRKKKVIIQCSSLDAGALVRQACSVGCIGCGMCVRACPKEAPVMENNLAKIVYKKCTNNGICAGKCPMKTIRDFRL